MKKLILLGAGIICAFIFVGCTKVDAQIVEAPTTEITTTTASETTTITEATTETSTISETQLQTTTFTTTETSITQGVEVVQNYIAPPAQNERKARPAATKPKTTGVETTTTSTSLTTTIENQGVETTETTTVSIPETTEISQSNLTFVKTFTRGTYYCYGKQMKGGSGRSLIACTTDDSVEIKGSIASSYLYKNYGYNYNSERTKVYLEIKDYSSMNGYYYLDDSDAGNSNVIDFFYIYGSNCPFKNQGVVKVDCYIVN